MRRPARALILLAAVVPAATAAAEPSDVDIVVALDRSESIGREEALAQLDRLIHTLRHARFLESVRGRRHGRIGLAVVA